MYKIESVPLSDIREEEILELMNNERIAPYLPLLSGGFSRENCRSFLKEKEKLWSEHGFGPTAFLMDRKFIGWGGLQPEKEDADFALILHPQYWGVGLKIFRMVKEQAFNNMGLSSITILLPPSRPNIKAIIRLGFIEEKTFKIKGEIFRKFRLSRTSV